MSVPAFAAALREEYTAWAAAAGIEVVAEQLAVLGARTSG